MAVGIAAVNTIAHIGTGLMNSIMGIVKDYSGSFPISLLPLCMLYIYGCHDCVVFGKKTDIAKSAKGSKVGLGFRNKRFNQKRPIDGLFFNL
ncbi:hypothetical protein VM83_09300 [Acinetobacter baumannii]|nr:hypothetical protein VM83_09300 [Acinetobacter baumannii]